MNKDALNRETRAEKPPKKEEKWPCPPRCGEQEWRMLNDEQRRLRLWTLFRRGNGEARALYATLAAEYDKECDG